MVIATLLDQSRSVLGFYGRSRLSNQCFYSQPVLSESGGNLQIVLEPHVSRNDECVAGTAVSGIMR
jgi:hypothetical protein